MSRAACDLELRYLLHVVHAVCTKTVKVRNPSLHTLEVLRPYGSCLVTVVGKLHTLTPAHSLQALCVNAGHAKCRRYLQAHSELHQECALGCEHVRHG